VQINNLHIEVLGVCFLGLAAINALLVNANVIT